MTYRYGRLTVKKVHHKDARGQIHVDCICDCGTQKVIRLSHLKCGATRSCGCLVREITKTINLKHGNAIRTKGAGGGAYKSRAYSIWLNMKSRCRDKGRKDYYRYGGKGIRVCQRWIKSFAEFLSDMGYPPEGMTLDRKRSTGNYIKANCRWATVKQQGRNTSRVVLSEHKVCRIKNLREKGLTIARLAEKFKVCETSISNVLSGKTWA